jgi:hypothetical protein
VIEESACGLQRFFERRLGASQFIVVGLESRRQRQNLTMFADDRRELFFISLELFVDLSVARAASRPSSSSARASSVPLSPSADSFVAVEAS